jgi:hypothetical protein
MKLAAVVAIACAIVSISSGVARAATISSTAQLTPGYSTIDFESATNGTISAPASLTIGDVTFSSAGPLMVSDIWVGPFPDASGKYLTKPGDPFDVPTKISFATLASEILLTWVDPSFSGNVLQAYDSSDNLLETAAVPVAQASTSVIGIKRASYDISYVLAVAASANDLYYIDNVHYNASPVPEPASVALMGLGMVAMGGCVWRRRRKA